MFTQFHPIERRRAAWHRGYVIEFLGVRDRLPREEDIVPDNV